MQKNYARFGELNTEIVAICVDSPQQNAKVKNKLGLKFKILSDSNREVIKNYKLFHDIKGGIARPAEYLIGADGKIVHSWVTNNFRIRTHAQVILDKIKQSKGDKK